MTLISQRTFFNSTSKIICLSFAVCLYTFHFIPAISPFIHEDYTVQFLLIQLYDYFGGLYVYVYVQYPVVCMETQSVFPKLDPYSRLWLLSALSCLLNCIPLVVAGRLFEECSLALAFKPTIYIPLCKLNMKPKSQNDFPACIFLLL